MSHNKCAVCGVPAVSKCSSCLSIFYCKREHQLDHWKIHKNDCKKKKEQSKQEDQILTLVKNLTKFNTLVEDHGDDELIGNKYTNEINQMLTDIEQDESQFQIRPKPTLPQQTSEIRLKFFGTLTADVDSDSEETDKVTPTTHEQLFHFSKCDGLITNQLLPTRIEDELTTSMEDYDREDELNALLEGNIFTKEMPPQDPAMTEANILTLANQLLDSYRLSHTLPIPQSAPSIPSCSSSVLLTETHREWIVINFLDTLEQQYRWLIDCYRYAYFLSTTQTVHHNHPDIVSFCLFCLAVVWQGMLPTDWGWEEFLFTAKIRLPQPFNLVMLQDEYHTTSEGMNSFHGTIAQYYADMIYQKGMSSSAMGKKIEQWRKKLLRHEQDWFAFACDNSERITSDRNNSDRNNSDKINSDRNSVESREEEEEEVEEENVYEVFQEIGGYDVWCVLFASSSSSSSLSG